MVIFSGRTFFVFIWLILCKKWNFFRGFGVIYSGDMRLPQQALGGQMEILNDEQILELCLMAINQKPEMIDSFPGEFLTYYVIKTMGGDEISDYEVAIKINELIADNVLGSLVEKGILNVEFDGNGNSEYTRTELELPEL